MRYVHTNIISQDWRRLAHFYQEVFRCELVPPQRDQSGSWLSTGTGVEQAALEGVHLRLPGHGKQGPTLEIYSYSEMLDKLPAAANRQGIGHLAFEVDDVQQTLDEVLKKGGRALGKVTTHQLAQDRTITFVYCCDPEDNIIELQQWG
jgi:catechol 2,3-dioxygenase-like lactoylglutathione lyase family enzyme